MTLAGVLITVGICTTASNYIYQWFANQNWDDALERSFFQAVALAIAGVVAALQS